VERGRDTRRLRDDAVHSESQPPGQSALHAKLDELVRVEEGARSELTQLDEEEPEVIERHRDAEVQKSKHGPQA
jgi:low affinity Fe/Cu permease